MQIENLKFSIPLFNIQYSLPSSLINFTPKSLAKHRWL